MMKVVTLMPPRCRRSRRRPLAAWTRSVLAVGVEGGGESGDGLPRVFSLAGSEEVAAPDPVVLSAEPPQDSPSVDH
jgi:hypothetical protein